MCAQIATLDCDGVERSIEHKEFICVVIEVLDQGTKTRDKVQRVVA